MKTQWCLKMYLINPFFVVSIVSLWGVLQCNEGATNLAKRRWQTLLNSLKDMCHLLNKNWRESSWSYPSCLTIEFWNVLNRIRGECSILSSSPLNYNAWNKNQYYSFFVWGFGILGLQTIENYKLLRLVMGPFWIASKMQAQIGGNHIYLAME